MILTSNDKDIYIIRLICCDFGKFINAIEIGSLLALVIIWVMSNRKDTRNLQGHWHNVYKCQDIDKTMTDIACIQT